MKGAEVDPRIERDAQGHLVTAAELRHRGQITIGLRLLEERERDTLARRAHRKLSMTEMRCLHEAQGVDLKPVA